MNAYARRHRDEYTRGVRPRAFVSENPRSKAAACLRIAAKHRREAMRPIRAVFLGDYSSNSFSLRARSRVMTEGATLYRADVRQPLP